MERPMFHESSGTGHIFTQIGSGSRPSRSTQSWMANGIHYTVETTSFSSPAFSVGAATESAGPHSLPFGLSASSTRGGGLLGSAAGLLGDMLPIHQAHHRRTVRNRPRQSSVSPPRTTVESDDDLDDDLIDSDHEKHKHHGLDGLRLVFSRIRDKLLDGSRDPMVPQNPARSGSREHSRKGTPFSRPRIDHRHTSQGLERGELNRAESHNGQPHFVEVIFGDVLDDSDTQTRYDHHMEAKRPATDDLEAMKELVESENRAVQACKQRINRALGLSHTSSHHLQHLVNELKSHEDSLHAAQASIKKVTTRNKRNEPTGPYSSRLRNSEQPHRKRFPQAMNHEVPDPFLEFSGPFNPFTDSTHDPLFQVFEGLNAFHTFPRASSASNESIFGHTRHSSDAPKVRFDISRGSTAEPRSHARGHKPNSSGGHGFRPAGNRTTFDNPSPPGRPPPSLWRAGEARALFEMYTQRWSSLSNTDDNIPYPARGLRADALLSRDTIRAPLCRADIATWSDEMIMQGNAQAFYLGAVGLLPVYREAVGTGSIEMGFDKGQATSSQLDELLSILKKEKTRWHSDRLGRRNRGTAGLNEGLQKDERARAVFHAVCGLMESAQ